MGFKMFSLNSCLIPLRGRKFCKQILRVMTSRHQTSADPDTFTVARIQYRLATREMDQVSELNSVLLEFPFAGQFHVFVP